MADGRPGDGDLRERSDHSSDHALATPAARVPARRRRSALVAAPLVILLVAGSVLYLRGGDRLTGGGGGVGAPVDIGDEFHTTVFLDTEGGTVELISARPLGATSDLRVDLRLVEVSGTGGVGGVRGPLDDRFRQTPLEGHRLRTSEDDDLRQLIDVRLVPIVEGIHQLRGVEVTYRSGLLRERTAVLEAPVCLSASSDWMAEWAADPEIDCPLPGE